MKTIARQLILLLTFFTVQSASAAQLFCSFDDNKQIEGSYRTAINSHTRGNCQSSRTGEGFKFNLEGFGPGIEMSGFGVFSITCTTKEKNLGMSPFRGIEAGASALIGAQVGVFVNSRGGVCVMEGLKISIGAGISGATLWL